MILFIPGLEIFNWWPKWCYHLKCLNNYDWRYIQGGRMLRIIYKWENQYPYDRNIYRSNAARNTFSGIFLVEITPQATKDFMYEHWLNAQGSDHKIVDDQPCKHVRHVHSSKTKIKCFNNDIVCLADSANELLRNVLLAEEVVMHFLDLCDFPSKLNDPFILFHCWPCRAICEISELLAFLNLWNELYV